MDRWIMETVGLYFGVVGSSGARPGVMAHAWTVLASSASLAGMAIGGLAILVSASRRSPTASTQCLATKSSAGCGRRCREWRGRSAHAALPAAVSHIFGLLALQIHAMDMP